MAFVLPAEQVKQGKAEASEEEISSNTNVVNNFGNSTHEEENKVAKAEPFCQRE